MSNSTRKRMRQLRDEDQAESIVSMKSSFIFEQTTRRLREKKTKDPTVINNKLKLL